MNSQKLYSSVEEYSQSKNSIINQIFILVLSSTAIFLSQQSDIELQKYACIFGLASQPFWFYATYKAKQWGMFLCSFIYTFIWLFGFYNNWVV